MSDPRDPELDDLFRKDPGLESYARLLRAARLKPPPLDPGFRHALRRQLMAAAYERYDRKAAPGLLSRLFTGPRLAVAGAVAAVLLVAVIALGNSNLFGPGQVQVTTVGAVAVDQPILVSFSQPMDHQSVEQAITIEPATQVTYSWQGNSLLIQPASGQLAPNTQYHVTVAAAARTAPGAPIGKPATVAVTTTALPTPTPAPTPSPTPPPPPQITAERSLGPGAGGGIVGWSPDGKLVFFIDGGDLKSVGADGAGPRTVATGVKLASIAPTGSALAYVAGGASPRLYVAALDGSGAQVADSREVDAIGWQAGRPLVLSQTDVGPAGAAPVAKLAAPSACLFSPDGGRLLCSPLNLPAGPSPVATGTFLFDVATQKTVPWTGLAQSPAWSPDGTRVAYWRDGATYVSAPDGSAAVQVQKSASPRPLGWSRDGGLLLLGGTDGAWVVQPDGSGLHQLSQDSFQSPAWAPAGSRFAFLRGHALWVDDVAVAGTALDLGAAGALVDQYEQARVKNDGAAAAALLGPGASPASPSPLPADLRLGRFFVISSQSTTQEATFTVRLVYARGPDEVRYQDEQLAVSMTPAGLRVTSVAAGALHDLGKGPTVNSFEPGPGRLLLVFDSDLDPATVDGAVTVTDAAGHQVPLTASYGQRRLTVLLKLTAGDRYTLLVAGSLKDIAGQPLDGGYRMDFVAPAGPAASPTP